MPSHFYIKQNDTKPVITAFLTDANDAAINLTGAQAVTFNMRVEPGGDLRVNASAATIEDAESGKVSYAWTAGNTGTAGDYEAEFQVIYAGGGKQTFPGRNYISVHIIDDIVD
jgi:hypothetical protein